MERPSMRKSFWLGVLVAFAVTILVGAFVVWSGVVDVAASKAGGPQDRVLAYAALQSIRRHAPAGNNPRANDPAALATGLQHYREMCVDCHGGPGAEPEEFAAGLHPPAPDLASPSIRAFTDGMLYQVIAGGIGSTGMPAFGQTHTPDEIWAIVAFVRHLPELTPAERAALGKESAAAPAAEAAHPPAAPAAPAGHGQEPGSEEHEHAGERVHKVTISDSKFDPPSLEVRQGDVVVWTNTDFIAHTATADDHAFDTGKLEDGQSKRIVAKKKGTFPYACRYHMTMRGTLIVK
jgi:plastocyanin/mono/diheme cytochrome c family protein